MARSGNGPIIDSPDIPPPDAPSNLDKYARFIASDAVAATKGAIAVCSWGTPPKGSFIRTHPQADYYLHLHVLVYEGDGKRKTYLLDPRLLGLPEVEGYTKIVRTVPWITNHGNIGIWPISIEFDDNPWIKSALNVTSEAQTTWLSAIAAPKQGQYRVQYPSRELGDPDWSQTPQTISGWLDLAISDSAWITDRDHPVLKRIRGE
jgi:hypothetical protein